MNKYTSNLLKFLVICIAVLAFGCGGGTTGTGNPGFKSYTIEGSVLTESGTPVSDAEVVVSESGESGSTDENGKYQVRSEIETGTEVHLQVSGPAFSNTVKLGVLPEDRTQLKVNLIVNVASNLITVESIDLTIDEPQAVATRTPHPQTTRTPSQENFTITFKGLLLQEGGGGVSGAKLSVLKSKVSTTTASNGSFLFSVPADSSEVAIQISLGGLSDTVTVSGLPKNRAATVTMKLVIAGPPPTPTPDPSGVPPVLPGVEFSVDLAEVRIR